MNIPSDDSFSNSIEESPAPTRNTPTPPYGSTGYTVSTSSASLEANIDDQFETPLLGSRRKRGDRGFHLVRGFARAAMATRFHRQSTNFNGSRPPGSDIDHQRPVSHSIGTSNKPTQLGHVTDPEKQPLNSQGQEPKGANATIHESPAQRLVHILQKVAGDRLIESDGLPGRMRRASYVKRFENEDEALYEEELDPDLEDRRSREIESIQRALVDQYRTAKLLHNFALMNYTGFVKIVKKHDKTLPDMKGRYKETITPQTICNEGKAVEALAERMELLYANWFCNRDISAARAQMLPKRGDGLEMDWSQLRLGYRYVILSYPGLFTHSDGLIGLCSLRQCLA
jgi:hypothetical protein